MKATPFRRLKFGLLALVWLSGAFTQAQGATLTWRLASWNDGAWDFSTNNWNPGPTNFSDGDDVIFNSANSGVSLDVTVRPSSVVVNAAIVNRQWLSGAGDLADYDIDDPTTVTINGVAVNTHLASTPSFSGDLTINGGTLALANNAGLNGFGTGDVVLKSGGRFQLAGTRTNDQTIRVEATGGSLRPINSLITFAGDVYLAGDLMLSGGNDDRAKITGDIILQADATITGGNTAGYSLPFTTLSGAASGDHTLTMDVNTSGRMTIDGANWSIGGLVKSGAGQLWIDTPDIIGYDGGMTILTGSGLVNLLEDQTLSFLTLGNTVFTEQGTFSTTHFDPTNQWFASTSTGMISIIPEPKTFALLFGSLASAFVLNYRRRKNGGVSNVRRS